MSGSDSSRLRQQLAESQEREIHALREENALLRKRMTVAEQLDAAAAVDDGGAAFGAVINNLFTSLEKAKDDQ